MKKLKGIVSTGLAIGCFLVAFAMLPKTALSGGCDALEVYHDCTETAYQNYEDGVYSRAMYYKFVDDYCRDAGGSCL